MRNSFQRRWMPEAEETFKKLEELALQAWQNRQKTGKTKSSRIEGLFKQVRKTLELLKADPRHPGLKTHEFIGGANHFRPGEKVFEAYAQNNTPGAYRVFWCYGPEKNEITILAITPHP